VNNSTLLSVIISTRDKPWSLLSKTLDSILSSVFQHFEVILVDQNNDGKIESELRSCPQYADILYFNSSVAGLSAGRNKGLKHARGSWLLFFDDDAILPSDALDKASPLLYENRDTLMIYYGSVLTLGTNRPYLKKSAAAGRKIGLLNFDAVCSIALLFNRKLFDEIGLFDENFGAGAEFGAGEESDILLRALKHGCRVERLNGFEVYHPEPATADLSKRETYGMGIGALYRKHIFSSLCFFFLLTIKLLVEILLRTVLISSNYRRKTSRKFHSCYLKGIIRGFFLYNRENISPGNCS
jgi:glycosyltransferase involved in cell wall biosynthesis